MPLTKSGSDVMANMKKQYGEKKGESVFYATANKNPKLGAKWHGAGDAHHSASAAGTAPTKATPGIDHVSGTEPGGHMRPGEAPMHRISGTAPSAGHTATGPATTTHGIHHGQGTETARTPKAGKNKIGVNSGNGKGVSGGGPKASGLPGGAPGGAPDRSRHQEAEFTDGLGFSPTEGGGSPFGDEREEVARKYSRFLRRD